MKAVIRLKLSSAVHYLQRPTSSPDMPAVERRGCDEELADARDTKQSPAKAGGFVLRTEKSGYALLNDASATQSGSILKSSFALGSK